MALTGSKLVKIYVYRKGTAPIIGTVFSVPLKRKVLIHFRCGGAKGEGLASAGLSEVRTEIDLKIFLKFQKKFLDNPSGLPPSLPKSHIFLILLLSRNIE